MVKKMQQLEEKKEADRLKQMIENSRLEDNEIGEETQQAGGKASMTRSLVGHRDEESLAALTCVSNVKTASMNGRQSPSHPPKGYRQAQVLDLTSAMEKLSGEADKA